MQTPPAASSSAFLPSPLRRCYSAPAVVSGVCPSRRVGYLSARPARISVSVVVSASASDEFGTRGRRPNRASAKSIIWNMIQEVEPLDTSVIQKDVPHETVVAMKRTISGMLGLMPSDKFQVIVEALWNPLFKLLISSIMTGYTLRNAEYRLFFERSLEYDGKVNEKDEKEDDSSSKNPVDIYAPSSNIFGGDDYFSDTRQDSCAQMPGDNDEELKNMSPKARELINHLQTRLSDVEKELDELRRRNSGLQMQQYYGEEENDLLDYLRSLHPDKVAEFSESTSPDVQEAIQSVAHGLLATLSPQVLSRLPPSDAASGGTLNIGEDDCAELVENASLRFQPLISVPRDHLARLLFWCMLLGHYIRGLEYRLELSQLLMFNSDV